MAGLKGRRWVDLCARFRASSDVHICGLPTCRRLIDLELPPRHPWSFSVDHIVSRSRGGALYDMANLQAMHYGCNSSKGNRPLRAKPTRMSREWR